MNFDSYQSPFSWRYASAEMRTLWSETQKRRLWRQIWVALAETQVHFGLVTPDQLDDLRAHVNEINLPRALEIEAQIHHDLMAELKTYAEQCPLGGPILHVGATSMDIEDNAEALRLRAACNLLLEKLQSLLLILAEKINTYQDLPLIAWTHLQPAEPTTLGYRLAFYAQDLLADWHTLQRVRASLRGKGFKGAVGTAAAYMEWTGADRFAAFEDHLSRLLNLPFFPITTQTYPRRQDYDLVSALAGLGGSIYKIAFDIRLLQSPPIGEISEPFSQHQVGSSAMPFKRNPIQSEKINSLARALANLPHLAWDNAAHSLLERTLDDSANRRALLPEAFLIADELLITLQRILRGLNVNLPVIQRNLNTYAPFAGTERLLMALVQAGADRQAMHEVIRLHAMHAWQALQTGQPNPLIAALSADPAVTAWLPAEHIRELINVDHYTGIASQRAQEIAEEIRALFPPSLPSQE